jgi:hypothetical protein
MKDMNSAFYSYLNKEKVYVSQSALGLVDARFIGVFLQCNPTLTFLDDLSLYCAFLDIQCPLQEQGTNTNPIISLSSKWHHHCINTHCNFESALITKFSQASPIQFNVIYFNCAFTKLIVPKEGNRMLVAMPAHETWVEAR